MMLMSLFGIMDTSPEAEMEVDDQLVEAGEEAKVEVKATAILPRRARLVLIRR